MQKRLLIAVTFLSCFGLNAQDSVSVLFIGNSYTSVNNLPAMLEELAESAGRTVFTGSKTNGGFTLANHTGDPLTFATMHYHPWDVVVLQAQSQEPSFPDVQVNTETIPYAQQLTDSIYAINPCSNALFYMTWGRENGDPQWPPISTFEGMNARLYNAYMRMADSTEAMVSPVGAVWKYVRDHYPSIALYSGDGSHPSVAGSYLAACTFYTSLFREPVTGASYIAGLDAQTAAWLQLSADLVVLDSLAHFRIHAVSEPVQASFTASADGLNVQFENHSVRDESWSWDFGDGSGSDLEQPLHAYPNEGIYNVQLIAANGCTADTAFLQIAAGATGFPALDPESVALLEYGDRFELTAIAGPLQYTLYDPAGKQIATGRVPAGETSLIAKRTAAGILILENERSQRWLKAFAAW